MNERSEYTTKQVMRIEMSIGILLLILVLFVLASPSLTGSGFGGRALIASVFGRFFYDFALF